ncbi:class I fructose-bisphosphate aldolase [Paracoccaceae bacterium GXU_MW_L88]
MTGLQMRLDRLFNKESGKSVIIALSNAMYFGPVAGMQNNNEVRKVVKGAVGGNCDAVMVTPGGLRANLDIISGRGGPAIIMSAGYTATWRAADRFGGGGAAHRMSPIASVEEALRLGADAYHLYTFLGWKDPNRDAEELELLGQICEEARRCQLPVVCEPLARGDAVDPAQYNSTENVALMARIASEVGADIVKVEYTGSPESFSEVVEASASPVVMMGGAKTDTFDEFLTFLGGAMSSGARGVAVGRNVYSQPDPADAVARTAATVHGQ